MEAVTGAQCWDGCTCEEKMMMHMRRAHNGGLMHFRRACSAVGTSATHPQNVQLCIVILIVWRAGLTNAE